MPPPATGGGRWTLPQREAGNLAAADGERPERMRAALIPWAIRVPSAFLIAWCIAAQPSAPLAGRSESGGHVDHPLGSQVHKPAASPTRVAVAEPEVAQGQEPAVAATPSTPADRTAFAPGSPIMIRIFKEEAVLELWMLQGERFELYATYPICHWSGKLGPKLNEGDKQSPEGLYGVSYRQLHWGGHRPRSLNIGFPNALDRAFSRSGSYILVHGGCTSIGCFAMTDKVMDEIFGLSEDALENDQQSIPVHIFPFRMTEANLEEHKDSEWMPFWQTLREAYDTFERTRIPPMVRVCNRRYVVSEGTVQAVMQEAATGGHKRIGHTAGSYCGDNELTSSEASDPGPAVRTIRRQPRKSARERYRLARIARKSAHAKRLRKQAVSYNRRATR